MARSIRHFTNSSRKAGLRPSGSRPKITGARSSTRSPAWDASSCKRRAKTGSGFPGRSLRSCGWRRPEMFLEQWFYTIPLRLRSLLKRNQVDRELDEELQYHINFQTEEHIARGLDPVDARRAALRSMGGLAQRKEECRDTRRVNGVENT